MKLHVVNYNATTFSCFANKVTLNYSSYYKKKGPFYGIFPLFWFHHNIKIGG